jgi:poly(3-hydroxybutyrate) depolymerase
MKKFLIAAVCTIAVAGFALADEFSVVITKIDGNKVSYFKADKGQKLADAKEMTSTMAQDVKVLKGKIDTAALKLVTDGPLTAGIKDDVFKSIDAKKGLIGRLTPDDKSGEITQIIVLADAAAGKAAGKGPAKGAGKGAGAASKAEIRTYDFKEAKMDKMEYGLFVPSKYSKDKKTPLMIALHGLGGNPKQMMASQGLTANAEKYGYIVAAPMGYNSSGWYGAPAPGGGKGKGVGGKKGGNTPANLGELSEMDVMNVLAECKKTFNVDEKRIYLIGHSMGGAGTWHIGTKYSEIWAGLAPIAPAAFGAPTNLEKLNNLAVFVVQGDADTLVPPAGARKWVSKLKELSITHEYLEIKGGDHGNVIGTGMPKIFEFFEKQNEIRQAQAK